MSDIGAWVRQKLVELAPSDSLQPGEAGQRLASIAQSLGSIQGWSRPMVFGMQCAPADEERVKALAPHFRNSLAAWRRHLSETHGEDGEAFFEDVLRRCGASLHAADMGSSEVVIPKLPNSDVLARLELLLLEPARLDAPWREAGYIEDEDGEAVCTWVGRPKPARLTAYAESYEAEFGRTLPSTLTGLLLRFDGVAVGPGEGSSRFERVEPGELAEPQIWSTRCGDPFAIDPLVFGGTRMFIVGELADSGFVCLGASDSSAEQEVFWVPSDFSDQPPTRLAPSFAAFIEDWCAAELLLPELLRRRCVPGWG